MPLLNMLDVIKIDIREHDENKLRELAGPLAKLPLKVYAWYDNEMGYACRMVDLACHMETVGI